MKFKQRIEQAEESHTRLLAINPQDQKAKMAEYLILQHSISHINLDIRQYAGTLGGPQRKDWHEITRMLSVLCEEADFVTRHNADTIRATGVKSAYAAILKKVLHLE